jgi:hypothetical protein
LRKNQAPRQRGAFTAPRGKNKRAAQKALVKAAKARI